MKKLKHIKMFEQNESEILANLQTLNEVNSSKYNSLKMLLDELEKKPINQDSYKELLAFLTVVTNHIGQMDELLNIHLPLIKQLMDKVGRD